MNLVRPSESSHGVCHNARMLPLLLAQVSNPPIIHIPPSKPSKWYETHRFWNGIVLSFSFGGWGFDVSHRMLAHVFFAAAWGAGLLSLWMVCRDVFPRRRILAWVLLGVVLAGIFVAMDFYASHR